MKSEMRDGFLPRRLREFFDYLDCLREAGGMTNMLGAAPRLQDQFGLTKNESTAVMAAWADALKLRAEAWRKP